MPNCGLQPLSPALPFQNLKKLNRTAALARRAARRFKYLRSATQSPEPYKSSERSRQPRARCEKGADELMSQPIACCCRQRKSNACYARHNEQPRRLRSGKQCQKVVHRPYPPCKTRIESLRVPGGYAEPGGTSFPFELVRPHGSKPYSLGSAGPRGPIGKLNVGLPGTSMRTD